MNKTTDSTEPDFESRRGNQRLPVLQNGYISYSVGRETMPCFVHDISETGARLEFASVIHVPPNFKLVIEAEDFSIDCIVVWRADKEIGVIFGAASF